MAPGGTVAAKPMRWDAVVYKTACSRRITRHRLRGACVEVNDAASRAIVGVLAFDFLSDCFIVFSALPLNVLSVAS